MEGLTGWTEVEGLTGWTEVEGLTGWTGAPVEDPPDLKNIGNLERCFIWVKH